MRHPKSALAYTALALAAFSTTALAEETQEHSFSANLAVTSDYVWRGVSQADNEPAIQGGIDYGHSSGIYVGAWASNVDFGPGDDSDIEIDLYGGFSNEVGGLSYDVGIIHYNYPGESDNNFEEYYFGIGYGFLSGKVSYTDEFGEGGDDATYYEIGADFELPMAVGLGLHAGHYDIDPDDGEDYDDWKIALSRSYGRFDFELAYSDTDLSDADCGGDYCDGRGIFTVSTEF
jgi:uncharacterized protein (TIGR02001 family)